MVQTDPPQDTSIPEFNILNCVPDNVLIELAHTCDTDLGVESMDQLHNLTLLKNLNGSSLEDRSGAQIP